MYAGARVDRITADWIVSVTSADAQTLVSRPAVISRNQQLERDNPHMEKILSLMENNVVGHRGIALTMRVKDSRGNLDRQNCEIVRAAWHKYSRPEFCSVSRNLGMVDLQKLAIRALKRDGGILFRKRFNFANDFRFAIEPIDIQRLDHNLNKPGTDNGENIIQFGIEMDKFRAPLFFHILTRHPGEIVAGDKGPRYREKVPASEIIFLTTFKRPGQTVGMPDTTTIMTRLNLLDKYDQAEVVAAFIASCKGGFLEKTNPDGQYEGEKDSHGDTVQQMEPGMIEELPAYMTYKPNDPQHPTSAYPAFVKTQLRAIASGVGVPYNDLANDLEGVNYSSIRSGMLEAREKYKHDQKHLIDHLMTPWFESWLTFALLSGEVDLPISKYELLNQPLWKPRRWPWIDPLKDTESALLGIEGGLDSRRRTIAESDDGADIEEIFEEQEADKKLAEFHKLDFSNPAAKPTVQAAPEAPEAK